MDVGVWVPSSDRSLSFPPFPSSPVNASVVRMYLEHSGLTQVIVCLCESTKLSGCIPERKVSDQERSRQTAEGFKQVIQVWTLHNKRLYKNLLHMCCWRGSILLLLTLFFTSFCSPFKVCWWVFPDLSQTECEVLFCHFWFGVIRIKWTWRPLIQIYLVGYLVTCFSVCELFNDIINKLKIFIDIVREKIPQVSLCDEKWSGGEYGGQKMI